MNTTHAWKLFVTSSVGAAIASVAAASLFIAAGTAWAETPQCDIPQLPVACDGISVPLPPPSVQEGPRLSREWFRRGSTLMF